MKTTTLSVQIYRVHFLSAHMTPLGFASQWGIFRQQGENNDHNQRIFG